MQVFAFAFVKIWRETSLPLEKDLQLLDCLRTLNEALQQGSDEGLAVAREVFTFLEEVLTQHQPLPRRNNPSPQLALNFLTESGNVGSELPSEKKSYSRKLVKSFFNESFMPAIHRARYALSIDSNLSEDRKIKKMNFLSHLQKNYHFQEHLFHVLNALPLSSGESFMHSFLVKDSFLGALPKKRCRQLSFLLEHYFISGYLIMADVKSILYHDRSMMDPSKKVQISRIKLRQISQFKTELVKTLTCLSDFGNQFRDPNKIACVPILLREQWFDHYLAALYLISDKVLIQSKEDRKAGTLELEVHSVGRLLLLKEIRQGLEASLALYQDPFNEKKIEVLRFCAGKIHADSPLVAWAQALMHLAELAKQSMVAQQAPGATLVFEEEAQQAPVTLGL